jgi:pSer/pThr/pTyr-binding forkhead associated (FHA) protein
VASTQAHRTAQPPQYPEDPLAPHRSGPEELKKLIAAERAGGPFVSFRDPDGALVLHVLEGELCTVGRRPAARIAIPWDLEVSGLHAELAYVGGEWVLIDDGLSANGTFVNGERVRGRRRLRSGDRVRAGTTVLAFTDPSERAVPKTAPPGKRPSVELTRAQERVAVALCAPLLEGSEGSLPATNQEIAEAVFLSVDAVKTHLRALFAKFELDSMPQNRKRARLAEILIDFGFVHPR